MKRIAVSLVLLLLVGAWFGFRTFQPQVARLKIENRSEEMIEELSIEVAGQRFAVGPIASGERREIGICEYTDSAWVLDGRWKGGAPIRGEFGYITHGMSFSDRLVFLPGAKSEFASDPR